MYNTTADPDRGLGKAAIRRIQCACDSCVAELSVPWVPGKSAREQNRYKVNNDCKYWIMFEGTHDWSIITCKEIKDGLDSDSEDLENAIVIKYADSTRETLVPGNIGAFLTKDENTDGYYIVTWTSSVYAL